jgi:ankyrin repeat protein
MPQPTMDPMPPYAQLGSANDLVNTKLLLRNFRKQSNIQKLQKSALLGVRKASLLAAASFTSSYTAVKAKAALAAKALAAKAKMAAGKVTEYETDSDDEDKESKGGAGAWRGAASRSNARSPSSSVDMDTRSPLAPTASPWSRSASARSPAVSLSELETRERLDTEDERSSSVISLLPDDSFITATLTRAQARQVQENKAMKNALGSIESIVAGDGGQVTGGASNSTPLASPPFGDSDSDGNSMSCSDEEYGLDYDDDADDDSGEDGGDEETNIMGGYWSKVKEATEMRIGSDREVKSESKAMLQVKNAVLKAVNSKGGTKPEKTALQPAVQAVESNEGVSQVAESKEGIPPTTKRISSKESADHRSEASELGQLLDLATESIPAYVERCSLMIVLVPMCTHAERSDTFCTYKSWRGRGWCRLEFLSALLARNNRDLPIMVLKGPEAVPEFVIPVDAMMLVPGEGDFTCCWRNHTFAGVKVPCDKLKIALILEQMNRTKVRHLFHEKRLFMARFFACIEHWLTRGLEAQTQMVITSRRRNLQGKEKGANHAFLRKPSLAQTAETADGVASKIAAWRQASKMSRNSMNTSARRLSRMNPKEATDLTGSAASFLKAAGDSIAMKAFRIKIEWSGDLSEQEWMDESGTTFLFWAVLANNCAVVGELIRHSDPTQLGVYLAKGLTENWPTLSLQKDTTVLAVAASFCNWEMVKLLLNAGADPRARFGKARTTALMMAGMFGRVKVLDNWMKRLRHKIGQASKKLVTAVVSSGDHGGRGNAETRWHLGQRDKVGGLTALAFGIFFAPGSRSLAVARTIIATGANPSCRNIMGGTLLHLAASNPDASGELIRGLLDYPGISAFLNTAMAPQGWWRPFFWGWDRLERLRCTKESTFLTNYRIAARQTPLHAAARWGNLDVVRELVSAGASLVSRDGRGLTPLGGAGVAFGGEVPRVMRVLLEEVVETDGGTPASEERGATSEGGRLFTKAERDVFT